MDHISHAGMYNAGLKGQGIPTFRAKGAAPSVPVWLVSVPPARFLPRHVHMCVGRILLSFSNVYNDSSQNNRSIWGE